VQKVEWSTDKRQNNMLDESVDGPKDPFADKSGLVQLTWRDVTITTIPPTTKCCGCRKIDNPDSEKTILNGVSGTVLPG
jgi:hypothetical protein